MICDIAIQNFVHSLPLGRVKQYVHDKWKHIVLGTTTIYVRMLFVRSQRIQSLIVEDLELHQNLRHKQRLSMQWKFAGFYHSIPYVKFVMFEQEIALRN